MTPQRAEIIAAGIPSGYLDLVVEGLQVQMLEAVGNSFAAAMAGQGARPEHKIAEKIREVKGVPALTAPKKPGALPDLDAFEAEAQGIVTWVSSEDYNAGEAMQEVLDDPDIDYRGRVADGSVLDRAINTLLRGPCKVGGLEAIIPSQASTSRSGLRLWAALCFAVKGGGAEAMVKWFPTSPLILVRCKLPS